MALIYITGPTGSGKSTICSELQRMGYTAYDTDNDGFRKIEKLKGREIKVLDIEVIKRLKDSHNNEVAYVCGTSPNDLDAVDYFDNIFLLKIDEADQKERIKNRTNSKYGKEDYQLANALRWRQVQIEKYQKAGAVVIDSTQPIETIINSMLGYIPVK